MLNLKHAFIAFAIFCCLPAVGGCGPGNDDHNFGIGKRYTFTEFTLANSLGGTFSLSQDELSSLERSWNKSVIADEINICGTVGRTGVPLKYKYVLNDGFVVEFGASYGTVNGKAYLKVDLLGDGGGFAGDVYWELVDVGNLFSEDRIAEFEEWLEVE